MRELLASVAVALIVAACGSTTASPSASTSVQLSASPSASASMPASPVVGIVTAIDSAGLGDVRSITLRTPDGRQLQVRIGTLENGASFPPGHLAEHLATAEPVRVFFRLENGGLVAYRIEDAGGPPSASGSTSPSPS